MARRAQENPIPWYSSRAKFTESLAPTSHSLCAQTVMTWTTRYTRPLKADKLIIDNWREKEATRDSIKSEIKDWLWKDTGLPESYTNEEISQKAEVVYEHIFRIYNTASPEIYATA
jgi:hypothetical protein